MHVDRGRRCPLSEVKRILAKASITRQKIKLDLRAWPFRPELVARGEVEIAVPQPSSRITLSLLPANPENLYHSHQFWIHADSSKEHTMTRKNLGPEGRSPQILERGRRRRRRRRVMPQAANATGAAGAASARLPSALPPTAHTIAAETGTPQGTSTRIGGVAGSDFMVDVIKSLDIDYLPSNPASSFRGLHESMINYGNNKKPEFLTCMHEESAVGMAHGYFKVTGKPLMTLCHGTVGLQHAAMAIYNAWCDRVPVIMIGGNDLDAAHAPAGRADRPLGAGHQRAGARLHQVGRHAGVAAALRAVVRARLQDRDDAALWRRCDLARRRPAAGADQHSTARSSIIPRYVPTSPPAGDTER